MRFRPVYVAIGILGVVCVAVGVLESYRLFILISLERQGKCDFVPCADAGTYGWFAGSLLLTVLGVALVTAVLRRQRRPRS
jgi:hypothetical protein